MAMSIMTSVVKPSRGCQTFFLGGGGGALGDALVFVICYLLFRPWTLPYFLYAFWRGLGVIFGAYGKELTRVLEKDTMGQNRPSRYIVQNCLSGFFSSRLRGV